MKPQEVPQDKIELICNPELTSESYSPDRDVWILIHEVPGTEYTPIYKRKLYMLQEGYEDGNSELTHRFPLTKDLDGVGSKRPTYEELMKDNTTFMKQNTNLIRLDRINKTLISRLLKAIEVYQSGGNPFMTTDELKSILEDKKHGHNPGKAILYFRIV